MSRACAHTPGSPQQSCRCVPQWCTFSLRGAGGVFAQGESQSQRNMSLIPRLSWAQNWAKLEQFPFGWQACRWLLQAQPASVGVRDTLEGSGLVGNCECLDKRKTQDEQKKNKRKTATTGKFDRRTRLTTIGKVYAGSVMMGDAGEHH